MLCSPHSARSKYVNEEVRLFRWRHPERPVIPVVIEGTYPDNFPPALRNEVDADGTITDRPMTPLGPDLREHAGVLTATLEVGERTVLRVGGAALVLDTGKTAEIPYVAR